MVQQLVLGPFGVLLSERPEPGEVGVGLVGLLGQQGVLLEGLSAATGLEQFFFGEAGDGGFAGAAACVLAQVGDGFVDLPFGCQYFGPPRPGRAKSGGYPWPAAPVSGRGGWP
jgi:hypothetical protein